MAVWLPSFGGHLEGTFEFFLFIYCHDILLIGGKALGMVVEAEMVLLLGDCMDDIAQKTRS